MDLRYRQMPIDWTVGIIEDPRLSSGLVRVACGKWSASVRALHDALESFAQDQRCSTQPTAYWFTVIHSPRTHEIVTGRRDWPACGWKAMWLVYCSEYDPEAIHPDNPAFAGWPEGAVTIREAPGGIIVEFWRDEPNHDVIGQYMNRMVGALAQEGLEVFADDADESSRVTAPAKAIATIASSSSPPVLPSEVHWDVLTVLDKASCALSLSEVADRAKIAKSTSRQVLGDLSEMSLARPCDPRHEITAKGRKAVRLWRENRSRTDP
jgi:hypothetical protein